MANASDADRMSKIMPNAEAKPRNVPTYRGVAAIVGALADRGISLCERTVRRLHAEGKLGRKLNGRTSPITATDDDIKQFLKGGRV